MAKELTQGAVVTRIFACRTCPVELNATDSADFVFGHIPSPRSDAVPFFDLDLHDRAWGAWGAWGAWQGRLRRLVIG